MALISTAKIRHCFSGAQSGYDQNAIAQQKIVQKLTALLPPDTRFEQVLEIGCGTGSLTRALQEKYEIKHWDIVDLCDCQSQIEQIFPLGNFRFHQADAETFSPRSGVDLIATASTVQWFNDKRAFIRRSAAQLNSKGLLLFSTFGERNLLEIKQLTGVGLDYPTLMQWRQWLEPDFEILHLSEEQISLRFANPKAVLRHLKSTGVTATSQQAWTKKHLQDFEQNYVKAYAQNGSENDRTFNGGVSLTYHPIYVLAKYRGE